jgi:hypothetical protein
MVRVAKVDEPQFEGMVERRGARFGSATSERVQLRRNSAAPNPTEPPYRRGIRRRCI